MITFKYPQYMPDGTTVQHTKTIGENTTLYWRSESVQVMSDIWEYLPVAYYEENGRLSQRIMNFEKDTVVVDATSDVFDRIYNKEYTRLFEREKSIIDGDALDPVVKGRIVKVTSGRSNKGVVGKVVARTEKPYSMGYRTSWEFKLGIALDDEMVDYHHPSGKVFKNYKNMVWVWARNCEVVNPVVDYTSAEMNAKRGAEALVIELRQRFTEAVAEGLCASLTAHANKAVAA